VHTYKDAYLEMMNQTSQTTKDFYKNPGPTQFFLPELTREDQMSLRTKMNFRVHNNAVRQIRDLCQDISNKSLYDDHEGILNATLKQL
jgi:hypothetical protein